MFEFFSDTDFIFSEKSIKTISPVLNQIFEDYQKLVNYLHVIFLDDEGLLNINQEFLKHDYYTDIITFNYAEESNKVEGELYISITRVEENAKNVGVDFQTELFRVIIHGVLHICGFEDNTILLKNIMQNAENKYINPIVSRETI